MTNHDRRQLWGESIVSRGFFVFYQQSWTRRFYHNHNLDILNIIGMQRIIVNCEENLSRDGFCVFPHISRAILSINWCWLDFNKSTLTNRNRSSRNTAEHINYIDRSQSRHNKNLNLFGISQVELQEGLSRDLDHRQLKMEFFA